MSSNPTDTTYRKLWETWNSRTSAIMPFGSTLTSCFMCMIWVLMENWYHKCSYMEQHAEENTEGPKTETRRRRRACDHRNKRRQRLPSTPSIWPRMKGVRRPPTTSCSTAETTARQRSRNRVVCLATLASDEDGAPDFGSSDEWSTRRPRAKAAAAEIVLGRRQMGVSGRRREAGSAPLTREWRRPTRATTCRCGDARRRPRRSRECEGRMRVEDELLVLRKIWGKGTVAPELWMERQRRRRRQDLRREWALHAGENCHYTISQNRVFQNTTKKTSFAKMPSPLMF
jgi:hypothetical protein